MCLSLPLGFSTILLWMVMQLLTVECSASHILMSADIGLQVSPVTDKTVLSTRHPVGWRCTKKFNILSVSEGYSRDR